MSPPTSRRFGLGLGLGLVLAVAALVVVLLRDDRTQQQGPWSSVSAAAGTTSASSPSGPASAPLPERVAVPAPEASGASQPAAASDAKLSATGRLVDANGAPVAGQEVLLQVGLEPASSDPRVRFLGSSRIRYESKDEATSAADGTFVLRLPAGKPARVGPAGDARVFRQGPLDVEPSLADAALGDIVVLRACVLAGVVQDTSGAPCAAVDVLCGVEARNFDESRATRVATAADGRFRIAGLANGRFRLVCRSPLHAPQSRTFELAPEQAVLDAAFALDPGASLSGRVVDDTGAGVSGAGVRAAPARGSGPTLSAKSGADGCFVVGGLAAHDSYKLTANASGHRDDKAGPVTAEPGASDVVVRILRAASIAGVVVDGEGRPVQGSRVRAAAASQPAEQDRQQILFNPGVLTGPDGRFAIGNLGAGEFRILAYGPHLDATVTPVRTAPGQQVTDLRIVVQRGGSVRVRVLAPDGAPVPLARVRVAEQSVPDQDRPIVLMGASGFDPEDLTLGQRVWHSSTDADGNALVSGLVPGSYRVRVAAAAGVQEGPEPFTLAAGQRAEVTVRLAAAGYAFVEVDDAHGTRLPKRRVELEGPLGAQKPTQTGGETGADGRVRVGPLAPGRWRVALGKAIDTDAFGGAVLVHGGAGPSYAATRVEVEVKASVTAEVRLVWPELVTLRGTLRENGPVADGKVLLGSATPDLAAGKQFGLDGSTRSVRTRPDGSFAIPGVEPGRYRLRWGRPAQEMLAERAVELEPGSDDLTLALAIRCCTLRVQVRSAADHAPLAGARAKLRRADDPKPGDTAGIPDFVFPRVLTADARTDSQGVAEFTDVPFGRYVIELQAARHCPATSATVAVDGGSSDTDASAGIVELRVAGRIAGTFVDPGGADPGQAYAEYRAAGAPDFQPSTAGRGKFEIDGLAPGEYVLRARRLSIDTPLGQGPVGPEVTVRIEAGAAATVALKLPAR